MKRLPPAAERNREPIFRALASVLPKRGAVWEVASGSGAHLAYFAERLPELEFFPSEHESVSRESMNAYAAELSNMNGGVVIDAESEEWPFASCDALININMIHISPWSVCLGLLRGASRVLVSGAPLFLYGPYFEEGVEPSPGNVDFDAWLRERDPNWGIRKLEEVIAAAGEVGLSHEATIEMPANNRSVVFRRS